MKKDISSLREDYKASGLSRASVSLNPFEQFQLWLNEAINAQLAEPNAFSLATVDKEGHPTIRTILLKGFSNDGLAFFTNYESPKALDMEHNPKVAMLFPWIGLQRQVKVLGIAKKVSNKDSLKYFKSRPLGAQLGAWASKQSMPIDSRGIIEADFQEVKERFGDEEVPLPANWGGYRVEPYLFEFWQGRADRLHDRFEYQFESGKWIIRRLSP